MSAGGKNLTCDKPPCTDCPYTEPDGTIVRPGAPAYVPGGRGVNPLLNNLVPANQVQEVAGVRVPSYVSVTLSWHFHQEK